MGQWVYEIVFHDGCTWVMKADRPILWFEGESPEIHRIAERAAVILGIRDSQTRNKRYERAQNQMARLMELPGVNVWSDAD